MQQSEATVASKAISVYLELAAQKEEAEHALDAIKEQLKIAEASVIEQMANLSDIAGVPLQDFKLNVAGYNWSVKQKTYYNVRAAQKEELFSLLESYGFEHIITKQVNRDKLTAAIESIQQDNGDEMPSEFEELGMSAYTETKVGKTRTSRSKAQ